MVLAITGALFVGLIAAQGNSLARRRYNDAVNSFRDFLQNQYDFGANIQNWREGQITTAVTCEGPSTGDNFLGRSTCVIYGVLLEFGTGDCLNDPSQRTGRCYIRYSWVVGADYDRDTLFEMGGDNLSNLNDYDALRSVKLRRTVPYRDYHLEWGAGVETPDINGAGNVRNVEGAVLIARMPISNTIKTFVYNNSLADFGLESAFNPGYPNGLDRPEDGSAIINNADVRNTGGLSDMVQEKYLDELKFMCIVSADSQALSWRGSGAGAARIIAIGQSASNASAVRLLDQDPAGGRYDIEGRDYEAKCR